MQNLINNALILNMKRIKSCGAALQKALDAYTVSYWNMELAKAKHLQQRLIKRQQNSQKFSKSA